MMRLAIFGVGILATVMGITITTIYGLWYLCADLVYVILFPQLVSVVYIPATNTYGSLGGYTIGLLFRLLGGEPLIHLPPIIKYPGFDYENNVQLFPFKTLCMFISFGTILGISLPMQWMFESGRWPKHWDVFQCVVNIPDEVIALKTPTEPNGNSIGEMTMINVKKSAEANGEINPALKFSSTELLDPSLGQDNKGLEVSPMTPEPPPLPDDTTGL